MAKGIDPFTKLEEQVKCPVCLDLFRQPKLLACTHALCEECADHLPVDVEKEEHTIKCPTCRKATVIPQDGTATLPPAFLINTLIELYRTLQKTTTTITRQVSSDDKCPTHRRPLDMYCNDCRQVVCAKCFIHDHSGHSGNFIADIFAKHQQELNNNLATVKQQITMTLNTLSSLSAQEREASQHGESVKNEIDTLINDIIMAVQKSGRRLKESVDTLVQQKTKKIATRKKQGEVFVAQLKSYVTYIEEKISNASRQEILLEKSEMIEKLKAISQQLAKPIQDLEQNEKLDIVFQHSRNIVEKYSNIGEISSIAEQASDQPKELIISENTTVAIVGKPRKMSITVQNVGKLRRGSLQCQLVTNEGDFLTQAKIEHVEKEKYNVKFTPTNEGVHHIKVCSRGTNLLCNSKDIRVVPSPETTYQLIGTIEGLKTVQGIAIARNGQLIVTESNIKTITTVTKDGHVTGRHQHQGGDYPKEVCVAPDDHILVLSSYAPHITKYTTNFDVVSMAVEPHPLKWPEGLAVSNGSGQVYVCDTYNNRIQVFNPDLTFSRAFGHKGSGPGQFDVPCGIAIDSEDLLYICDGGNYRIQKLSSNGKYISKITVPLQPIGITIGHNDMLYVTDDNEVSIYDNNGDYLGSIPSSGEAVAVDHHRHMYMCDGNTCTKISVFRVFND